MIDIKKIRADFPMLNNKMNNHDLIYFDNAATAFKSQRVIDAVVNFYTKNTANAHRGDYTLSFDIDQLYEQSREKIAQFINSEINEVVFTANATAALNTIAYGYGLKYLKENDVILISTVEHASNVLPWFAISKLTKAKIEYVNLDENNNITLENVKKALHDKVKIVSFAQVGNVLANLIDIKNITKEVHKYNAIMIVDGAQSVAHYKVDVKDLDCDFLCFSAHKLGGPSGVGALFGKYELLEKMDPLLVGGGNNSRFYQNMDVVYYKPPRKFEAGTQNIEGVIGFKAAIEYLESIGMENIAQYENELKEYAINKLSQLNNVIIYNENIKGSVITFNIKNVFAQDAANYFSHHGICLRAGNHCAKLLDLKCAATLRASFAFYNTKEEIDKFIEVCKNGGDFLDVFFG